ncbi:MAG: hypothetical protein GY828_03575 [Candidatus Gracilibacteria bacterium]|nr:hypothetical protein [Candidatus Gracilibacteria bacterium]
MIKTYKSIKEYAEAKGVSRQTMAKRYKNNLTELREVPKGAKYYEIDKEAVIAEYISNLTK